MTASTAAPRNSLRETIVLESAVTRYSFIQLLMVSGNEEAILA